MPAVVIVHAARRKEPWCLATSLAERMAQDVITLDGKRFSIEALFFFESTQTLAGELETLDYPRAALFGFGIALAISNVLATVKASLRAAFGATVVENNVSGYFIANEVRR